MTNMIDHDDPHDPLDNHDHNDHRSQKCADRRLHRLAGLERQAGFAV